MENQKHATEVAQLASQARENGEIKWNTVTDATFKKWVEGESLECKFIENVPPDEFVNDATVIVEDIHSGERWRLGGYQILKTLNEQCEHYELFRITFKGKKLLKGGKSVNEFQIQVG